MDERLIVAALILVGTIAGFFAGREYERHQIEYVKFGLTEQGEFIIESRSRK